MTEHAVLLLNSIVEKYQRSTGPQHMRGGMLHTVGDEYWPGYIYRCGLGGTQQPAGLNRAETWLDQVD